MLIAAFMLVSFLAICLQDRLYLVHREENPAAFQAAGSPSRLHSIFPPGFGPRRYREWLQLATQSKRSNRLLILSRLGYCSALLLWLILFLST